MLRQARRLFIASIRKTDRCDVQQEASRQEKFNLGSHLPSAYAADVKRSDEPGERPRRHAT
jgi:hypothetical protein